MEKQAFLEYLDTIGLTPQAWWDDRNDIHLNIDIDTTKHTKDIEKLIKLYGKNNEIMMALNALSSTINRSSTKTFTVEEILVTDGGEGGYGEEIGIILYIPEFKYILKSTGNYYSYSSIHNFSNWEIVEKGKNSKTVTYVG